MSVDGIAIEFQHLPGDTTKPTLVLLHEGMGCIELWRDFPQQLAAATGRSVFAYSRMGYGESAPVHLPRPLDYMRIEAVEVLPALLKIARISTYTLVGHSDGASIALTYAGQIDDRGLQSIVIFSPHVFVERCAIESIELVNEAFATSDLRQRLIKYHKANADGAFRGWCYSWLNPRFRQWSIESDLAGIVVPVLQIQGRDDQYGTLDQLQRIKRSVAASVETFVLDNCGHSPDLKRIPETLAAIAHFCG